MPQTTFATPAELEYQGDKSEQGPIDQHWRDEFTTLRQKVVALEGGTPTSSVSITTLHNPAAFASSVSTFTWVIDSKATDHATSIQSDFLSYTPWTQGRMRIADGSLAPIIGKGNITVSQVTKPISIFCPSCT